MKNLAFFAITFVFMFALSFGTLAAYGGLETGADARRVALDALFGNGAGSLLVTVSDSVFAK